MIVIGVPCRDMIQADFWLCFDALWGREGSQIIRHRSCYPTEGRNAAANQAVDIGAEWLFFLDPDMMFPPNTLVRLLAHDKDIVGATYAKRTPPHESLGRRVPTDSKGRPFSGGANLCAMAIMPAGCLLIRTAIFTKFTRPYFRMRYEDATADNPNGVEIGEDVNFCEQARSKDFDIWCDLELSRQIGHIGQKVNRL